MKTYKQGQRIKVEFENDFHGTKAVGIGTIVRFEGDYWYKEERKMKKLYIYTTVEGFEGSWDEALAQRKVEIVATIGGDDQKTVEKKAYELYGDSDTYGWTYSAEGISEAEEVEEIKV